MTFASRRRCGLKVPASQRSRHSIQTFSAVGTGHGGALDRPNMVSLPLQSSDYRGSIAASSICRIVLLSDVGGNSPRPKHEYRMRFNLRLLGQTASGQECQAEVSVYARSQK